MGRKGIAGTTIAFVGLIAVGLIGSAFSLGEITNLLNTLFSNIYSLSFIGIIVFIGVILYSYVKDDKVSQKTAWTVIGSMVVMLITAPFVSSFVTSNASTWTAKIKVKTSQSTLGTGDITYQGLEIVSVEQGGSRIFANQQACIIGCEEFTVELQVVCGDTEKTTMVNGHGGDNPVAEIRGLPSNKECEVTGIWRKPKERLSGDMVQKAVFFTG